MAIDTVLYEIYTDLGLTEIMQNSEVEEFISQELENAWQGPSVVAA